MVMKLAAVVFMTPIFLIPGFIVGLVGGWVGQIYMAAQLSVKREMSNAKAPVVGQLVNILELLCNPLTPRLVSVLRLLDSVSSICPREHTHRDQSLS